MACLQRRQPFEVLDESRLQTLTSIKNIQNSSSVLQTPFKAPSNTPAKRRFATQSFPNDVDSENVDPNLGSSSSKRLKREDAAPFKTLNSIHAANAIATTPRADPDITIKSKTGAFSAPRSSITTTVSIADLRGSPQNKRLQLLAKRRSSTPLRRHVTSSKAPYIPFSIDAALCGTISSYNMATLTTPTAPSSPKVPDVHPDQRSIKSMPNTWFFDIHEDTAEQEATNMMQHSAFTLDISSGDDFHTARAKDALEIGKENIPPPEYACAILQPRSVQQIAHKDTTCTGDVAKCAVLSEEEVLSKNASVETERQDTSVCPGKPTMEARPALREICLADLCSDAIHEQTTEDDAFAETKDPHASSSNAEIVAPNPVKEHTTMDLTGHSL